MLSGDTARYHQRLTQYLTHRFNTTPLHEKVAPHITVKIPFEANATECAGVEHVLQGFVETHYAQPLTVRGFGRFGHRTVYLNAQEQRGAVQLVRDCVTALNALPWMQQVPHEGNTLHASVARFLTRKQFRRIWRHVAREAPHFEATFDSIALLKKVPGERTWQTHRTFRFVAPRTHFAPELLHLSYEQLHSKS